MKEPRSRSPVRVNPFTGDMTGGRGGFAGFATMSDEIGLLESNRYAIESVYIVRDQFLSSDEEAMCANGGWFYVWEYVAGASVYFVPAGESDTFSDDDRVNHFKIGQLAFGKSKDRLALMTTISEDAMDILNMLGELYEESDLIWKPLRQLE